jgi:hypothetical protein
MVKDLFGTNERAKEKAERRWRNAELTARFLKMKETGEGSEDFAFRDGKKYFATEVPKPPRDAPPKPADLIENEHPRVSAFERKFKKDLMAMMEGHKRRNAEAYLAVIAHERRKLLKEKIRRLELSIAASEARIAAREGAKT